MAKYHISKNGQPAICKAKGVCPLGGEETHFASIEKAQEYIDNKGKRAHGLIPDIGEKPKETLVTIATKWANGDISTKEEVKELLEGVDVYYPPHVNGDYGDDPVVSLGDDNGWMDVALKLRRNETMTAQQNAELGGIVWEILEEEGKI